MTDQATRPRHAEQRALTRSDFPVLWPVTTRWSDNDMYGHLNNATYFQLFDTAINGWLATVTGEDPVTAPVIGVVAESRCVYFGEVGFPQRVTIGLRVVHLGRTSVGYELGVFAEGVDPIAAFGQWTHVYVDRESRVPCTPSPAHRAAFEGARVPSSATAAAGSGEPVADAQSRSTGGVVSTGSTGGGSTGSVSTGSVSTGSTRRSTGSIGGVGSVSTGSTGGGSMGSAEPRGAGR